MQMNHRPSQECLKLAGPFPHLPRLPGCSYRFLSCSAGPVASVRTLPWVWVFCVVNGMPCTEGSMWAAACYSRWGLHCLGQLVFGRPGHRCPAVSRLTGEPAAPGADTHKAVFLSCYLFSSFHHRLLNLELRTLFSSSSEALLQLSITGSGGTQWSNNKNNSESALAQIRTFTADSCLWFLSNHNHSFKVISLVSNRDGIEIYYQSSM